MFTSMSLTRTAKNLAVIVLALVIISMPMGSSLAMGSPQGHQPNCPPFNPAQARNPGFIKSLPLECRAKYRQAVIPQQNVMAQALSLASAGPDDFGYTYDDTVPFEWISASTDSGITGDDFVGGPLMIGAGAFTFTYYGGTTVRLFVDTNGAIYFNPDQFSAYGGSAIPNPASPNYFIAAFFEDLLVGESYNSGGIYYSTGGVAPNRYFVIEWRDVTTYSGSDPFSFEAVLYENGDILIQHQSLPATYFSTVGIEDPMGTDGLGYQSGDTGLSAPRAIKFYYPTTPTARVTISPLQTSSFAGIHSNASFIVNMINLGTLGTDTYNLSSTTTWAASYYQEDCVTPLTDTNADTVIDTGPLLEGDVINICVSFTTPAGSKIGDSNLANLVVTSSINPAKTKSAVFNMSIPAPFAQVFVDFANYAMLFMLNSPDVSFTSQVTDDNYFASEIAMIDLPDGQYLYAWAKYGDSFSDIEYAILSHDATSINLPVTKLTNNMGADYTYDFGPAVAVTPNGTIGVTWSRYLIDPTTGQGNYNIYFATLSNTGSLLSGPFNVTNNNLWDSFDNINVPHFDTDPAIAATDDNRFVLSWADYRTDGENTYLSNIWYTIRESTGTSDFEPMVITTDSDYSYCPILNPLIGGNVILTFGSSVGSYYAVINSSGAFTKTATLLGNNDLALIGSKDAVLLPNGKVAIASGTYAGVILFILDESYSIIAGPIYENNPLAAWNHNMSITYDTSNHIIMTWSDFEDSKLFYAMADSTGTFLTDPMVFRNSPVLIITSYNGQGNAPYITSNKITVSIDIKPGSASNPINVKSFGTIPVAILSSPDFDAPTEVDKTSLTFGRTGEEESVAFCNSIAADVNGDGLLDQVCHFKTQLTHFQSGDTEGILLGQTVEGVSIEGHDVVSIVK